MSDQKTNFSDSSPSGDVCLGRPEESVKLVPVIDSCGPNGKDGLGPGPGVLTLPSRLIQDPGAADPWKAAIESSAAAEAP